MPRKGELTTADLVHHVIRASERPLTANEVFERVQRMRPISARDPRAAVRGTLTRARTLVSLGDGTYGYLPRLVNGNTFRIPMDERWLREVGLRLPDEAVDALWPSATEIQKRNERPPFALSVIGGGQLSMELTWFQEGGRGFLFDDAWQEQLDGWSSAPEDALLLRGIDGEAHEGEIWHEPRSERPGESVAQRNAELADTAARTLRSRARTRPLRWELMRLLVGRGAFRAEPAPDPLVVIVAADPRFVDDGFAYIQLVELMNDSNWASLRLQRDREHLFQ